MKVKKKECFGCKKPKKIWKNIEGKKYCQGCAASAGVASATSKPKAKPPGKALPKVSSKKAKLDIVYSTMRLVFLKNHPMCQCGLPGCTQKSTEVHHKSGREGELYLDTTEWLAVCRSCHVWITKNSKEAVTLGFSTLRLETKDDGDKKKLLTLDELDNLPPGIFRSGNGFVEHPWFNDATFLFDKDGNLYDGEKKYGLAASKGFKYVNVNWVAVRGGIPDWTIYHSLDANLEPGEFLNGITHLMASKDMISRLGAKLRNDEKIREFVPCDEASFGLYRF